MNSVQQNSHWFNHSLRLLKNELKRGELTIVFLAIVLAVATVFSLAGFTEQVKQAIVSSSTNTIAADRILRLRQPIDQTFLDKSDELSLKVAKKLETESMVFAEDRMLLSEIDAVSELYPLRGDLTIKRDLNDTEVEVVNAPPVGSVFVEASLLSRLQVEVGGTIEIGVLPVKIAGILVNIPDRSYRVFIAGPAIIMNIDDMPKTELIKPGSRMNHKYLFAGERDDIDRFEKWVKPKLNDTERWYDAKAAQNRLSRVLDTAEKFLSLASMLGIVLAAVAVAVASRRYGQRHQPTVAVFKALGASYQHIVKLYVLHWGLLSLISVSVGLIVGFGLINLGEAGVAHIIELGNTDIGYRPFVTAVVTGLLCALAFAIHPMSQLVKTSPLAVIRGFANSRSMKFGVYQLVPLAALFILLYMFSGDVKMSAALLIGGLLVSLILLGLGQLIMTASRSAGSKAGKSLHLALANLKRRALENSVQLVSFTIAIKLLLLISVMKDAMISEWEAQFPPETPNHYLVNITKDQVAPLAEFAKQNNIATQGFYPVYRGRLTAINGEETVADVSNDDGDQESRERTQERKDSTNAENSEQTKPEKQGRKGMGRELGLTWRTELPIANEIVEGQWWSADDQTPQVSIAQGVAERLEVKLGDELTFSVGTDVISVPVTSIRDVDWQSRQLNFVMIFNEPVFRGIETTSISAWKIPDQQKAEIYQIFATYPTISIIDLGAIMKQLNKMIEQVTVAIELILLLVVLAGSLVLVAQVQASMEERERELAILRTLGAKGSLLRNSILFEFVALGVVAGLMASIAMEIGVFILQTQVFEMDPSFHLDAWLLGIISGGAFVGIMGMLSCWRLLSLSSVTLIRRTM
ncbi:ABC transporter permease [Thalassotalea ganghwensis]